MTAGAAKDGTMQYALGTAVGATDSYSTSIPKGTDVGTYYVWYKAVDTIAALTVADQINKLPDPVTLDDEAAVTAARAAFAELTDAQKTLVPENSVKKLTAAETTISDLHFAADKEAAAAITVKIGKVKNLKGGKAKVSLGEPNMNASQAKAASVEPALSAQDVTGINGFIIQYSTDKKFKKGVKTKTIENPAAKSATIKHLKKGKTYYFRACTYTEVKNSVSGDTKAVKGKWSAKMKVKITK